MENELTNLQAIITMLVVGLFTYMILQLVYLWIISKR